VLRTRLKTRAAQLAAAKAELTRDQLFYSGEKARRDNVISELRRQLDEANRSLQVNTKQLSLLEEQLLVATRAATPTASEHSAQVTEESVSVPSYSRRKGGLHITRPVVAGLAGGAVAAAAVGLVSAVKKADPKRDQEERERRNHETLERHQENARRQREEEEESSRSRSSYNSSNSDTSSGFSSSSDSAPSCGGGGDSGGGGASSDA
jgi:uncharacterized membrane protein YgcG